MKFKKIITCCTLGTILVCLTPQPANAFGIVTAYHLVKYGIKIAALLTSKQAIAIGTVVTVTELLNTAYGLMKENKLNEAEQKMKEAEEKINEVQDQNLSPEERLKADSLRLAVFHCQHILNQKDNAKKNSQKDRLSERYDEWCDGKQQVLAYRVETKIREDVNGNVSNCADEIKAYFDCLSREENVPNYSKTKEVDQALFKKCKQERKTINKCGQDTENGDEK